MFEDNLPYFCDMKSRTRYIISLKQQTQKKKTKTKNQQKTQVNLWTVSIHTVPPRVLKMQMPGPWGSTNNRPVLHRTPNSSFVKSKVGILGILHFQTCCPGEGGNEIQISCSAVSCCFPAQGELHNTGPFYASGLFCTTTCGSTYR